MEYIITDVDESVELYIGDLDMPIIFNIFEYAGDWYFMLFASLLTETTKESFGLKLRKQFGGRGLSESERTECFAKKIKSIRKRFFKRDDTDLRFYPNIFNSKTNRFSFDRACRNCFSKVVRTWQPTKDHQEFQYENAYCSMCLAHMIKFKIITDVQWIEFRDLCLEYFGIPKNTLDQKYCSKDITLAQYLIPSGIWDSPKTWLKIPIAYRCHEGLFFRVEDVYSNITTAQNLYQQLRYNGKRKFVRDTLASLKFYQYISSQIGDIRGWLNESLLPMDMARYSILKLNKNSVDSSVILYDLVYFTGTKPYRPNSVRSVSLNGLRKTNPIFGDVQICEKLNCEYDDLVVSHPEILDLWEYCCYKHWIEEFGIEGWLLSDIFQIISELRNSIKLVFVRDSVKSGPWYLFYCFNALDDARIVESICLEETIQK